MNSLDIIFALIALASCLYGLLKGLIGQIVVIAGTILGFVVGSRLYESVGDRFFYFISNEPGAQIAAFVVLFLLVLIAASIVGKLLGRFIKAVSLQWLNRLLGMALGVVGAVLIAATITAILTIVLPEENIVLAESKLAPHTITASRMLSKMIPGDMKRKFEEREDNLRALWDERALVNDRGI